MERIGDSSALHHYGKLTCGGFSDNRYSAILFLSSHQQDGHFATSTGKCCFQRCNKELNDMLCKQPILKSGDSLVVQQEYKHSSGAKASTIRP